MPLKKLRSPRISSQDTQTSPASLLQRSLRPLLSTDGTPPPFRHPVGEPDAKHRRQEVQGPLVAQSSGPGHDGLTSTATAAARSPVFAVPHPPALRSRRRSLKRGVSGSGATESWDRKSTSGGSCKRHLVEVDAEEEEGGEEEVGTLADNGWEQQDQWRRTQDPEKLGLLIVKPPPPKRARLNAPGRLRLPPRIPAPTPCELNTDHPGIVSPLFFSNSHKYMPGPPPGFAASEVAISMMSGVYETKDGVTTLRLPKGQVSSASPARSSSTSGSWSSDRLVASRSPQGRSFFPTAMQLVQSIGLIELLESDERPIFIVDLSNLANFNPGPLYFVYANVTMRSSQRYSELIQADTGDPNHPVEFSRFKAWALSFAKCGGDTMEASMPSTAYGDVRWTCTTIRKRFRVISGITTAMSVYATPSSPRAPGPSSSALQHTRLASLITDNSIDTASPSRDDVSVRDADYFGDLDGPSTPGEPAAPERAQSEPRSKAPSVTDAPVYWNDDLALPETVNDLRTTYDWTRIPLDTPNLTEHIRFARSVDWASTPLGPVELWSADLRSMSNMIMGSPHPAAMYWGSEYIAIYNEAYLSVAGQRHPMLMGMSYKDAWAEIWDEIEPIFTNAWKNGQAMMKNDHRLFMTRNGYLEEIYFDWSIVPLVGSDGSVVAIYNPAFEITRRKVNERRMLTLQEIGEKISQARDVKSFWKQVRKGLEYNEFDVPFALIYSVNEDAESDVSSMQSGGVATPPTVQLEGSLGVPPEHALAVTSVDLRMSDAGFAPYMRRSMGPVGSPIVLSKAEGTLPDHLTEGLAWRGFGDTCRHIVVFPVHPTTAGESIVGFIVLGVNPRGDYDENYKLFVNLLSRQLATSMASVVLFEEEIKRGQRAAQLAALDRQVLSTQLRMAERDALESEYRFSRMAEFGPVGMFIADYRGSITYCNDMWWQISGHKRQDNTIDSWMLSIHDEDRKGVEEAWRRLVADKVAVTHEFRFNKSRHVIDGHTVATWVLLSAYPERQDNGDLKSIFGCLTDISQQKWAEDFQKKRREEAVELKRQQENFIDITSHEMRNPLSAILQCADEIASSVSRYQTSDGAAKLEPLLESCVEAAGTISLCASHQKRIVDDILTLSKLDSQLLLVTPVDVQPIQVVQNVLKMFESELNSHSIRGEFRIENNYRELQIDWVKVDPSRMRQVLINLMTNAIKFTQGRHERAIIISLGATDKDMAQVKGLEYIPSRQQGGDLTDRPDWGDGEKLNLHITVQDTGPGLDEVEKQALFQRFQQLSPRTHVQYGGSGLGLFICRTLTELQGGQIGVDSEKGVGSTFAFYVKARKVDKPQPEPRATVPTRLESLAKFPSASASTAPQSRLPIISRVNGLAGVPGSGLSPIDSPPSRAGLAPLNVLIVEDNVVNQRVLQRQLVLSGNNTHVSNHGREALRALSRSKFWNPAMSAAEAGIDDDGMMGDGKARINVNVILMDLEMPIMDGMTCARKIRELERTGVLMRHIPIIAVTAYARPEQIENAKAAGVDDVISKPFRIPELLPKIEELVVRYGTAGDGGVIGETRVIEVEGVGREPHTAS